jgi:hypothetical protein
MIPIAGMDVMRRKTRITLGSRTSVGDPVTGRLTLSHISTD